MEEFPVESEELDQIIRQAKIAQDDEVDNVQSTAAVWRNKRIDLVTYEQRAKLSQTQLDLEEFGEYLRNKEGINENYIKAVLRLTKRLKSGEGISYGPWNGAIFRSDPIRNMATDFFEMRKAAMLHEAKYGKANSGKQFLGTIHKLANFQYFLVFGKTARGKAHNSPLPTKKKATTPANDGMDSRSAADRSNRATARTTMKRRGNLAADMRSQLPARKKRRVRVAMALSDEQRNELSGIRVDLAHFTTYLADEQGLFGQYLSKMCQQVKKLIKGEKISCKNWPDGVGFKPDPITLGTNFCDLREQAILYEEKHGEDISHGYALRLPISKLIGYQAYYYECKLKSKASTEEDGETETAISSSAPSASSAGKPEPDASAQNSVSVKVEELTAIESNSQTLTGEADTLPDASERQETRQWNQEKSPSKWEFLAKRWQ